MIDLTKATVRPSGTDGVAARTAAGFIVLGSRDAVDHVAFIEEHQTTPEIIELLAARVTESRPGALSMLFTAGGEPYLFAWGTATSSVTTTTSRFTITPVAGELLVHPLAVEADSTVVLSNGRAAIEYTPAAINLAEGSMQAQAVVVDLAPKPLSRATPIDLPPLDVPDPAPDARPVPASSPANPDPAVESVQPPVVTLIEPAETSPRPAPEPVSGVASDATEMIPVGGLAFGQPAAEEIVFADDLEQISDLIEPGPVPETHHLGQDDGAASAPAAEPPAAIPEEATVAEVPPEFVRDVDPAITPIDPLETTPLPDLDLVLDPPSPAGVPAMVLGAQCPNGHHNHPEALVCTTCGATMPREQTVILVNGPRPPLGLLVVDDGTTVSIDHDLVIGRDPMSHEDVRSGLARPMTLTDETLSLSRQHARLVLQDWTVSVTDLNSSNGTWLNRSADPQDWSRVEPGTLVEMRATDRLRIGGRVIQVELHHSG